jgi:hypothetical protein
MTRILYAAALLPLLVFGSGCAMCENCFDYDSPAQGGICADAGCGGRAGSIITPAYGETILGEKVIADGAMDATESQPTAAVPPVPEDVPLPEATPEESAEEGLSMPGFGELTAPDEPGAFPNLAPPAETTFGPLDTDSSTPAP